MRTEFDTLRVQIGAESPNQWGSARFPTHRLVRLQKHHLIRICTVDERGVQPKNTSETLQLKRIHLRPVICAQTHTFQPVHQF